MMKIKVEIEDQELRRKMAELRASTDGPKRRALMLVLGKGLEQDLQKHFRRRDAEPNKKGWKKQHFWSRMRKATSLTGATKDGATVTIADPAMAAKVHGATIRPTGGRKYLAIPAREEVYGTEPGKKGSQLIKDLFVRRAKKTGKPYLARREEDGSLAAYYWLVRKVQMPADPRALPPEAALGEAATKRATSWILRRMKDEG